MTLVREPGSEILAQFGIPTRGTWRNTAINTVPLDAVYDSNNIFVREGKLRRRPGLTPAGNAFVFAGGDPTGSLQIIGGMFYVFRHPTPGLPNKILLAVSHNFLHLGATDGSGTWSRVPGVFAAGTGINQTVDTAQIETGPIVAGVTNTHVLFAEATRALLTWKTGDASATTVTGTNIPLAKSICISASRVIALVPPHTIVWSRILDFTNFDALAIVKRAQTADAGVCVRSLSALSFILYKESSIHPARAQSGLDEGAAFAFFEPIVVEGPAGIFAVVDVEGAHIYMTKSGRIAIFDGTAYPRWIADGIWLYLQNDINQAQARFIRGVYDYRLNTVIFYYPRTTDVFSMSGIVIINLPYPGFEAQLGLQPYCFLGVSSRKITHTYTKREDADISRAQIFSEFVSNGAVQSHELHEDSTSDSGINFDCSFQTGLESAPDARHIQTTTESFLERDTGYGSVSLIPVTSDTLETSTGTIHTADAQTIDLTTQPVNEFIGFNKKTRFFGFKYTWVSTSNVKYSGTVVYDSVKRRK